MKTMTCKQLGGPCDFPLHGDTADEVIKAQDKHLNEIVSGGDETHESALKEMKNRWKHPLSGAPTSATPLLLRMPAHCVGHIDNSDDDPDQGSEHDGGDTRGPLEDDRTHRQGDQHGPEG